jgi:hypothetical protein
MTHEVRQGPTLRGEIISEVASLIVCLSMNFPEIFLLEKLAG